MDKLLVGAKGIFTYYYNGTRLEKQARSHYDIVKILEEDFNKRDWEYLHSFNYKEVYMAKQKPLPFRPARSYDFNPFSCYGFSK